MSEIVIGILNAHNTLNYGNMMMCENAIFYLSKILPNASFVVLSDFVEETENRLKKATGCNNINVRRRTFSSAMFKRFSNKLSFVADHVIFRYKNLNKTLEDCHVVIVLGGDDISEYYGNIRLVDILLKLRYLKRGGKKVYLLGQTIGPMSSWRIPLAKDILGEMDKIYHRGPISYEYVTETLGIKGNSFLSADLAFLDLAGQTGNYNIERFDLHAKEYITFVPSGFWSSYCFNHKEYLDGLLRIKNYLLKVCDERQKKLLLLPHVLRTSNDRALINQMIAAGERSEKLIAIKDILLPYEAREILGKSYLVVSQRMHGAISSLQRGVPAICLSYSVKFSEVVGRYLNLPELVIDIRKTNYKKDLNKLRSAVDSTLENMSTLKIKIEEAVTRARDEASVQIDMLARDILSKCVE